MTRYAVGDIQGCLEPLQCLMAEVNFDQSNDQLWLLGDLINRGPDSLSTLRYIRSLGDCTRIILGNHDLHLIAVSYGANTAKKYDTFHDILEAEDGKELVEWLRMQPLMYEDGDYCMTHAGIPPNWSTPYAAARAREVEAILHGDNPFDFLKHMYGNEPAGWHEHMKGWERYRTITNYFTRMRFCNADGDLDLINKLDHCEDPAFAPWFSYPPKFPRKETVLFGHWASLEGKIPAEKIFGLDTGCVWGRGMTMMNLETQQLHHCDCGEYK
jgi:bis(5'-nucleosyl)-tetraphosphatase (symmetrical)